MNLSVTNKIAGFTLAVCSYAVFILAAAVIIIGA